MLLNILGQKCRFDINLNDSATGFSSDVRYAVWELIGLESLSQKVLNDLLSANPIYQFLGYVKFSVILQTSRGRTIFFSSLILLLLEQFPSKVHLHS